MKKISSLDSKDRLSPLTQRGVNWLNWSYAAIALGSALSHLATTPAATAKSTPLDDRPLDTFPSDAIDSKQLEIEEIDTDINSLTALEVSATSSDNDPALSLNLPPPEDSSSVVTAQRESFPDWQMDSDAESIPSEETAPDSTPERLDPPTRERTPSDSDAFLPPQTVHRLDQLFVGGTDSLVAKAVGAAEGTRTPEGEKTWAYYGHTDPGNGVFNQGTFSYQHGASSPEEADQKQLLRLRTQIQQIQQDAENRGITLGLEEQLNAIDLANQSPKAALSYGGYLDRLQEAYQMGLRGSEAILWARVRSYIDPNTQTWNAPGLGNDANKIEADQQRRMDAIARAIMASQSSTPLDSYSFNAAPPDPTPQPVPRSPALQLSTPWFPEVMGYS